jgi:hypothetical protein
LACQLDETIDLLNVIEEKKKKLYELFIEKKDFQDEEIYKMSCMLDHLIIKAQRSESFSNPLVRKRAYHKEGF